jgi:hypothetical protein
LSFTGPNPLSDYKKWDKLSSEERVAASALGYTKDRWDSDASPALEDFLSDMKLIALCIALMMCVSFYQTYVADWLYFRRAGVSMAERECLRRFIIEHEGAAAEVLSAAGPGGEGLIAGKLPVSSPPSLDLASLKTMGP